MSRVMLHPALRAGTLLSALAVFALPLGAQTMVEQSVEAQFQLDVEVPHAALARYLPPGFSLNVSTEGNAKDANLRVIFIDRLTINAPDGAPIGDGSNRLVYMIAPITDPSGQAGQLVIGGLSEEGAPGPFGNYLPARGHVLRQARSDSDGSAVVTQHWRFDTPSGEHLEMRIVFERGPAARRPPADVRFYSAANPRYFEISRQERVLEVVRNATTNPPDRVRDFSFTGGGGSYADLFDGTERMLSWDDIPWVDRQVLR